jgi:hypothetical protein
MRYNPAHPPNEVGRSAVELELRAAHLFVLSNAFEWDLLQRKPRKQ